MKNSMQEHLVLKSISKAGELVIEFNSVPQEAAISILANDNIID
jgi:hypothetical protein